MKKILKTVFKKIFDMGKFLWDFWYGEEFSAGNRYKGL